MIPNNQTPELVMKVTGMIIQLQDHQLNAAILNYDALQSKVKEAVDLISAHGRNIHL